MIRQPEIEELKKLLNNTDSSVIGISRGTLEDVVQEHEEPNRSELYNQGLADAWELAKKVVRSPKPVENAQIFLGKNIVGIERESLLIQFFELTPQEAIEKMKAYEEAQNIKRGDVVKCIYKEMHSYGVYLGEDETDYWIIYPSYDVPQSISKERNKLEKTGKHIDIQQILEQIGGE